ncbi:TonB-dependent receptor [Sphingomonas mucosissima]|uniref:Putative TonB-dependent receptor n=1 Tax=Sphingomonas mucosissima TaxID=370959 RepID=A0A245ZDC1_9SPHN|nr:TonB-dependent receptor [Sphingomonas mucosissima]OWK27703.1 putative TonB-dependent receptor precursor [Sphingomonas mucosissima]
MATLLSFLVAVAAATESGAAAPPSSTAEPEDIVITGILRRDPRDSASPVSVLDGAKLERELRPQIGEALARLPGVSGTSFGPNVSRPILRGLGAERVRVLTDGIGAFDVSNTSADHAVAIDPLLSERIEVLRGPASLRFGSSAIGGVVNVLDRRIPVAVPDDRIAAQVRASFGSAADERSAGANLAVRLTDNIVISGGGSLTDTEDARIGGPVLSAPLRAQARASSDPAIRELADLRGRLPNTASRTRTANLGAAVIDSRGDLGFAVTRYESAYGLPIRFDLTPGAEQEAVLIDAQQWRADLRASVVLGRGWLERLSLRAGYADYAHVEREGDGGVGTLFANEGIEARAELQQRRRGAWQGISGAQYFARDFLAVGAEAFVPPNMTEQAGVFTLQELDLGAVRFEAGGRIERTSILSQQIGFDRSFTARSIAGGAFVTAARGLKLGVNLSSTARAPAAEELLANGPHIGTQSYEIGNPDFGIERARGVELVARLGGGRWRIDAAAYRTRFAGYIYEFETGAVIDGLPVFQFAQGDATYRGFEVEAQASLVEGPVSFAVDSLVDAVEATIDGFGPAPRIPPLRFGGGMEARGGSWGLRLEGERTTRQTRTTGFETATRGFSLVNISGDWKPWAQRDLRVTLTAANLFNVEARRHASFLKDYAPLVGRDVRLGLSARF